MADMDKVCQSAPLDAPYGYCPQCGAPGINRERRPDGNDTCEKGHTYPSKDAVGPNSMAEVRRWQLAKALELASKAAPTAMSSIVRFIVWSRLRNCTDPSDTGLIYALQEFYGDAYTFDDCSAAVMQVLRELDEIPGRPGKLSLEDAINAEFARLISVFNPMWLPLPAEAKGMMAAEEVKPIQYYGQTRTVADTVLADPRLILQLARTVAMELAEATKYDWRRRYFGPVRLQWYGGIDNNGPGSYSVFGISIQCYTYYEPSSTTSNSAGDLGHSTRDAVAVQA